MYNFINIFLNKMEQYEYLQLIDTQRKAGFCFYIAAKRSIYNHYICTLMKSKNCQAGFRVEISSGKVVDPPKLNHSHPGQLEPYYVIDVANVRLDGVAGD